MSTTEGGGGCGGGICGEAVAQSTMPATLFVVPLTRAQAYSAAYQRPKLNTNLRGDTASTSPWAAYALDAAHGLVETRSPRRGPQVRLASRVCSICLTDCVADDVHRDDIMYYSGNVDGGGGGGGRVSLFWCNECDNQFSLSRAGFRFRYYDDVANTARCITGNDIKTKNSL